MADRLASEIFGLSGATITRIDNPETVQLKKGEFYFLNVATPDLAVGLYRAELTDQADPASPIKLVPVDAPNGDYWEHTFSGLTDTSTGTAPTNFVAINALIDCSNNVITVDSTQWLKATVTTSTGTSEYVFASVVGDIDNEAEQFEVPAYSNTVGEENKGTFVVHGNGDTGFIGVRYYTNDNEGQDIYMRIDPINFDAGDVLSCNFSAGATLIALPTADIKQAAGYLSVTNQFTPRGVTPVAAAEADAPVLQYGMYLAARSQDNDTATFAKLPEARGSQKIIAVRVLPQSGSESGQEQNVTLVTESDDQILSDVLTPSYRPPNGKGGMHLFIDSGTFEWQHVFLPQGEGIEEVVIPTVVRVADGGSVIAEYDKVYLLEGTGHTVTMPSTHTPDAYLTVITNQANWAAAGTTFSTPDSHTFMTGQAGIVTDGKILKLVDNFNTNNWEGYV